METTYLIVLWVHIVAIGLGGAPVFGMQIVGPAMRRAPVEAKPYLMQVAKGLSITGAFAMLTLIVSGAAMIWLGGLGLSELSWWFWVKMVLVLALLTLIIVNGANRKRAATGEAEAIARAPKLALASLGTYLAVLATGVAAFN